MLFGLITVDSDDVPGPNSTLFIHISGPSAPPKDLILKDTTSTSLLVAWDEVPDQDKNGIIISYTVGYRAVTTSLLENTTTVCAPKREANLTDLIKNMNYSVRVLASTVKGNGNYSKPKFWETNQDGKCIT